MRFRYAATALLASWVVGCARYEYDIVSPPEMAQHVGERNDVVLSRDPLQYRLISADNHLIMRIFNATGDRIQLLGSQSVAVDPQGQSHPLRNLIMAPNSFVKLILPPMKPQVAPSGPVIGIGVGFGYADPYGLGYYDPLYDSMWQRPRYYAVYDADNTYFWDWPDQGDVRLTLVFQRDEQKPFSQEFVFHRRKM
jgi:hypothetical protein